METWKNCKFGKMWKYLEIWKNLKFGKKWKFRKYWKNLEILKNFGNFENMQIFVNFQKLFGNLDN